MARMRYDIVLSPEAARQFQRLPAYERSQVRDALERHLRHQPDKTSRSRIKRLRGIDRPQYRLRVGEIRVYYDVTGPAVEVLAVLTKAEGQEWLSQLGEPG